MLLIYDTEDSHFQKLLKVDKASLFSFFEKYGIAVDLSDICFINNKSQISYRSFKKKIKNILSKNKHKIKFQTFIIQFELEVAVGEYL